MAWVGPNIASTPAGPKAIIEVAATVSTVLGVIGLLPTAAVSGGRGEGTIEGDGPALRISLELVGLGIVLIGIAPPPDGARIASLVCAIVERSPRMRPVFKLLAWLARAVNARSGGYLVVRVVAG